MSQSLNKTIVHIIFSTKHRNPLIDFEIEPDLHRYMGGILNNLECLPIQVGGYKDHIHIICLLSRKISIMKLLEEIKKPSSRWMKTKSIRYQNFYWQDGYAIFSVDPEKLDEVVEYVRNQHKHHEKISFQDECRLLFKQYGIDFDERYFWD
jgi:putative transposase